MPIFSGLMGRNTQAELSQAMHVYTDEAGSHNFNKTYDATVTGGYSEASYVGKHALCMSNTEMALYGRPEALKELNIENATLATKALAWPTASSHWTADADAYAALFEAKEADYNFIWTGTYQGKTQFPGSLYDNDYPSRWAGSMTTASEELPDTEWGERPYDEAYLMWCQSDDTIPMYTSDTAHMWSRQNKGPCQDSGGGG